MNIPEGVTTVTAEGRDLKLAIAGAAEQLGVHPAQVDYKLDLNHFRNAAGVSMARTTVRIVAWGSTREVPDPNAAPPAREAREPREARPRAPRPDRTRPERPRRADVDPDVAEEGAVDPVDHGGNGVEVEARGDAEPGRPRRPRRADGDRDRDRDRDRAPRAAAPAPTKPDSLRGAEAAATPASDFAQEWFQTLLGLMDVDGTATGTGSDERVHLAVKAERAGRIVGKRGATLGSIRHILGLALDQRFGPLTVDVDVGDDRPPQEREARADRGDRDRGDRDRAPERADRADRGDRGDRGDRRGRGGDRGRGGRGGDRDQGRYPEPKLRALARRAAEKAIESGQTITINLELNSFDRRIVHLEVSEIDGVESQSEERAGSDGRLAKFVQIIPLRD